MGVMPARVALKQLLRPMPWGRPAGAAQMMPPGRTSKSTLNSTGISPNDFEILFADRIGGAAVPSALVMRISLPVDASRLTPIFVLRANVKVFRAM